MTAREYREKYPVGTKIKYIGSRFIKKYGRIGDAGVDDIGKKGRIVGYERDFPVIFLPQSNHVSCFSTHQVPASWETGWDSLEILLQKNQQLEFSFME